MLENIARLGGFALLGKESRIVGQYLRVFWLKLHCALVGCFGLAVSILLRQDGTEVIVY